MRADVERRAEARPLDRPCGRWAGRWTGDLSVGALDPALGAHARFDETSRVGDPLPLSRSGHGWIGCGRQSRNASFTRHRENPR